MCWTSSSCCACRSEHNGSISISPCGSASRGVVEAANSRRAERSFIVVVVGEIDLELPGGVLRSLGIRL